MAGSHRTFTSKPTKEVRMRGDAEETDVVFSYVSPAQRVPKDHPLRIVREITDAALQRLSRDFEGLYSKVGRPSVPPERLLRALLLQYFYGVRSERLLMEQLEYNLLFRWFVGLGMDDRIWDATTFTKNRERLLSGDVARLFLEELVAEARSRGLTSDEHFSVDGTIVQAWAGQKSFKPKDEPPKDGSGRRERDFRGEEQRNDTHVSSTDPQARLYRKSQGMESRLSYLGMWWSRTAMDWWSDVRPPKRTATLNAVPRSSFWPTSRATCERPWARTRGTTRRVLWRPRENKASHRMSLRTSTRADAVASTAGPRGIRATRSANDGEKQSSIPLAGSRVLLGCAK